MRRIIGSVQEGPSVLNNSIIPKDTLFFTCHLNPKSQLLRPRFTDVFSSIFPLYAINHELSTLAL